MEQDTFKKKQIADWKNYLMFRDYCRLIAKKYGNTIFKFKGIQNTRQKNVNTKITNIKVLENAHTGIPIIDATILELKQTGYIKHIQRKIIASFILNNLNLDWRIGAEFFESYLIDYDVCSNYVNWQIMNGIGPNSKEKKVVNIINEGKKFDPQGAYLKTMLPILKNIDNTMIHTV